MIYTSGILLLNEICKNYSGEKYQKKSNGGLKRE